MIQFLFAMANLMIRTTWMRYRLDRFVQKNRREFESRGVKSVFFYKVTEGEIDKLTSWVQLQTSVIEHGELGKQSRYVYSSSRALDPAPGVPCILVRVA